VGGAADKREDGSLVPAFPNARYWTTQQHYDWAYYPNARERASFLKENFVPLKEAGVLHYFPEEQGYVWDNHFRMRLSYGHTESMLLPEIRVNDDITIIYAADLIPSAHHVGLPYIMGYDIRPLVTLAVKTTFLADVTANGYPLFLGQYNENVFTPIRLDQRGRPEVGRRITLQAVRGR